MSSAKIEANDTSALPKSDTALALVAVPQEEDDEDWSWHGSGNDSDNNHRRRLEYATFTAAIGAEPGNPSTLNWVPTTI